MRRYWLPQNCFHLEESEPWIEFSGDSFHHIFDVCRQTMGSKFEVLGKGQKAYLVEITDVQKKRAQGRVLEAREIPAIPNPRLVLCLSLPRFPVLESVIEKSVELGVSEIRLFTSDFSFLRHAEKISPQKVDRWEKIVISATQQSGRADLMPIRLPERLDVILKEFNQKGSCRGLFAYEGASRMSIKESMSQGPREVSEIWIFVGSEGGFSNQEVEQFQSVGLQTVTLGEQVLRVETACIALVSVLKYEFDLMKAHRGSHVDGSI